MSARAQAQGSVGPFEASDRYTLTELRSRGGEGELWLGTVEVSGQDLPVAVKVVNPPADMSMDSLSERLRTQAELLRSLDHPNLVKVREAFDGPQIHPVGEADVSTRSLYLVMNYVPGDDLSTWVERRPERDVLEVSRIITRLAAALDYLHSGEATGGNPVLHRDVKPANVIVGPDGAVRLVDFGFAKLAVGDSTTLVGTPAYLAPEIIAGAAPTAASDRYGLGGVAYFLFTGEAPALTDRAALRAKLLAVKGVEDREGFADHILAMLHRDPSRRPTDVVTWAQGLAMGAVSQRFPTAPLTDAKPRRRGRLVAVLALVVLLLGGGVGAYAALGGLGADSQPLADESEGSATEAGADSDPETGADATTGELADEPVEVPNVEGLPLTDAESELTALGFEVTTENEASGEAAGTVLRQDPTPGTTDVEVVHLVVAVAPDETPEVIGERLAGALRTLEPLGVEVTTVDVLEEGIPDGEVIDQEPAAGEPFSTEMTLSVARQPVITYLSDHYPVEGSMETGSARVSGATYTRSVSHYVRGSFGGGDSQAAGYDLGRHYREFRATVGLSDDAPSASVAIVEAFGDGRSLFRETLELGDAVAVDVDVTGVLRLELMATITEGGGYYVVWGDAQVLGAPDEVPPPTDD